MPIYLCLVKDIFACGICHSSKGKGVKVSLTHLWGARHEMFLGPQINSLPYTAWICTFQRSQAK